MSGGRLGAAIFLALSRKTPSCRALMLFREGESVSPTIRGIIMIDQAVRGKRFFKVKDRAGNEWLCPLDALKNVKEATQEELDDCVERDVVTRYPGDIEAER